MSDPSIFLNLKGHSSKVTALKYHPDGVHLLSCSEDASVMMWNVAAKDARCCKFTGHTEAVTDVDCTVNGELIASCSLDSTVRLHMPSSEERVALRAHRVAVTSLQFSPDNSEFCTSSEDQSIKLWDTRTYKCLATFTGHTKPVTCARFALDGNLLVSASEDNSIRIWDVKSLQCLHTFETAKSCPVNIAPRDDETIAVAMSSGSVRIYDIKMKRLCQHYTLHDKATSVAWHPNGQHFVSTGADGTLRIVDVLEGRPLYTLQEEGGAVASAGFSLDGRQFACAGEGKTITVWQTNFIQ